MRQGAGIPHTAPRGGAPGVIRAREPLRILGTSVTQTPAITRAAQEDLGVQLAFITRDGTKAQRQGALSPESFDVYDQWFHDIDLIWPTGSIQPLDVGRIQRWEEINDLPKTGRLRPDQPKPLGGDPSKRLYVQLDGSLGDARSNRISMVPTVHNADSFAVIGADPASIQSWAAFLDPEWAGRVVLQADAAIGTLDMLLALQARGELQSADLGDLTLEEIDALSRHLSELIQGGHFLCVWADEAEAVAAMQNGGPMIGSLWWSGVTKLRAAGTKVSMVTPLEGYRGWFGGLAMSRQIDDWSRDAAYDYINWWLDGRPGAMMARTGAYMANPEAVRPHLTAAEWAFWYEGKPAETEIHDPDGVEIFGIGEAREGGDYHRRMSRVRVWDTVMNEHNYLVRQWERALRPMLSNRFRATASGDMPEDPVRERRRSP